MKNFSKIKNNDIYITLIKIVTIIILFTCTGLILLIYKQNARQLNIYFLLTSKINGIYTSSIYQIDSLDTEINKSNIEKHKIITADKGKIYQDFCKYKNHTFLVGGEFGDRNNSGLMSELYLDKTNNSFVSNNITSNYEKRIRDCSVGRINNEDYIGLISHGKGYTFLYNINKNKTIKIPTSYYGEDSKKTTLIHHIEFTDLDGDGNDEIYVTPTSEASGENSGYQLGKILQIKIDNNYKIKINNISSLENGYAKRVKSISIGGRKKLLTLYQSSIKPNGEIRTPTTLSVYSYSGKEIKREDLYSFGNELCFRIETFKVSNDNTFQVGCGNGTLYLFRYNTKVELLKKYILNDGINEEYGFDNIENAWNKIYVRTIYGKDIDNDGFDELFLGISNVGLYYINYKNNITKRIVNLSLNDYNRGDNIIFGITDSLELNNNILPLKKF